MSEGIGAPAAGPTPPPPRLVVGGRVSGGRYELLAHHGGVAGQSFWRARDKRLGRDVALTFCDPLPGEQPPGSATTVLDRTVALTGVYSEGLARVLDVIRGRAGGIVVSEWVPGRSLAAAVAEPDPDSAVSAVWGLSDAATKAESDGLALGLDSPDRIRLTEDGRALLAFPGVSPSADARGDVRGLGATLYALLIGTWPVPLPEGSDAHTPVDGRPGAAPRDNDDKLVDPTLVRPGVPQGSAVLAMRSLDGTSVSSAATVRSMIVDRTAGQRGHARSRGAGATGTAFTGTASTGIAATAAVAGTGAAGSSSQFSSGQAFSDQSSSGRPSAHSSSSGLAAGAVAGIGAGAGAAGGAAGATAGEPGSGAGESSDNAHPGRYDGADSEPYTPPDEQTLKRRWQIMAGTSAVAVIVVALLGAWMLGALAGGGDETPLSQQLDAIERAAEQSRSSPAAPADTESTGDEAPASTSRTASTPVDVADATSWQPSSSAGTAENSSSAPNVVDGDPSTTWSTDTYRSQLGDGGSAYKPGIGLMLTLDTEEEADRVVVKSEDEGVRFEVRASDSASPTSLDDTTLLGEGTVRDGTGTVTIDKPEKSEFVLVWITRLGTSGPQAFNAQVTEVTVTR